MHVIEVNLDSMLYLLAVSACQSRVPVDSEIGRQWSAAWRTSGSLLQRSMGNSLWWLLWQPRR